MIDCGELRDPVNGQVLISSTTFGGLAMYSCDMGYSLATETSNRSCGTDRTWSGTTPTCGMCVGGLSE